MSKELELIAGLLREVAERAGADLIPDLEYVAFAADFKQSLSGHGCTIVHHRPTCSESGDNCKHLPDCVVSICVCGDDWPCPILAIAAAAEEEK